ncbi:MAG: hypothetical protein COV52_00835 [Gammaproteobacteria bacterium CG11_big_fil_rev_8_21_14_0_20_46_22]|nr:MAG: hypothetical protein COW05_06660 [Gammaproteobacteria bacterium CG12_big_fil_rev_8_21_14_0_65_46_12]PIR12090.1 MAG: hypothetical protein COV52_00835 [Gammaproteobacteria bacterium CG11_big_fil_rev_8_21_14_0_20_46_22]
MKLSNCLFVLPLAALLSTTTMAATKTVVIPALSGGEFKYQIPLDEWIGFHSQAIDFLDNNPNNVYEVNCRSEEYKPTDPKVVLGSVKVIFGGSKPGDENHDRYYWESANIMPGQASGPLKVSPQDHVSIADTAMILMVNFSNLDFSIYQQAHIDCTFKQVS